MLRVDLWFGRPESMHNILLSEAQEKAYREFMDAESEGDADDAWAYFLELLIERLKDDIVSTIDIEVTER